MEIPTLYRSFKCEAAVNNHYTGRLWFRSYEYFRRSPGPGQDPSEGIGTHSDNFGKSRDIFDKEPFPSVFVLCFSEVCSQDFGPCVVRLSDPDSLMKRVKSKTPEGTEVCWKQIEYNKKFEFEEYLMPSELIRNKHYAKPDCFAHEKEWRLVLIMPPEFRILNDTLKLHVGSTNDLLVTVSPELERGDN